MIDPGGTATTIETVRCTSCVTEMSAPAGVVLAALRCGWTIRRDGAFHGAQARGGAPVALAWSAICPLCAPPPEIEADGFVTLHPRLAA